jgi:hypothetical protein
MKAILTAMGDDAPRGPHVRLATTGEDAGLQVGRVAEAHDRDAGLLLVGQAGDALLDGPEVRAALDLEGREAVPREARQEARTGHLLEEGPEAGRCSDRGEALAPGELRRRRRRGCGLVSLTVIIQKSDVLAFELTSLGGGDDV